MDYLVVVYLPADLVASEWFSIAFRTQLRSPESQEWSSGARRFLVAAELASELLLTSCQSSRRQVLVAGFVCSAFFL